ncbi:unnamed protein product [Effrenium voratum]|nr:unnamed protein product [Effrenium voratum]
MPFRLVSSSKNPHGQLPVLSVSLGNPQSVIQGLPPPQNPAVLPRPRIFRRFLGRRVPWPKAKREVLRGAKEAADRVAIVTLSARPWVFESADQYLPGLDMAELLKELQIPVYYAPEHTQATDDTQDPHVNMKRNAMQEFLHLFGDTVREDALNVISIGDSLVEKEAAQATARLAEDCGRPSMCKTIKLIGDPSLKQLRDELSMLKEHLPTLCTLGKNHSGRGVSQNGNRSLEWFGS